MNINRDVVIKRFERLDTLLKELNKIKNGTKEKFIQNFTEQLSAQRALVLCINICIDVGAHILSQNRNGKPETYSQIFEELEKLDIIDKELKENLIDMVRFRNVLGHLYMEIDNERVYEIIQNDLNIFDLFKKKVFQKFKNQLLNEKNNNKI
jgi:uncharacterized protein YutE (UPF0331/DUF86 family)